MSAADTEIRELNYFIQFYLSLVAYYILHMIFVISSDFVDSFNIPPLNIGIYIDKLAAIRALLMVIADIVEWAITQKAAGDPGNKSLEDATSGNDKKKMTRRLGSILSFLAMIGCRSYYLYIVYKPGNKSLSVFVVLCIEGFWFGIFQMSFFAIGPQYNAVTSFGIHTIGNFIFFFQLILEHYAKSIPKINPLYRVRVHGWICLISSVLALGPWIWFCYKVKGEDETGKLKTYLGVTKDNEADQFKNDIKDIAVWSPFLLFIVGAFAEDFSVPGILPFAFLDPEKANLVNYLTPSFSMSGSIVIVFLNDVFTDGDLGFKTKRAGDASFKKWSANKAPWWHALWALNIPKYIAFFISMFSIHGIFPSLRCIVQSRWRVLVLTMFIIIPRAILEVGGYVGVANYALALAAVSDYSGFDYIVYHDMLAMFCRFFYGKLAVGYNWTKLFHLDIVRYCCQNVMILFMLNKPF